MQQAADLKSKFISADSLLFGIALAIWIVVEFLQVSFFASTFPPNFVKGVKVLVIVLFVCSEIRSGRFSLSTALILGVVIIFSFILYKGGNTGFVVSLLAIYFCRNYDYKFLLKVALYASAAGLLIVFLGCAIGLIPDYVPEQSDWRNPRHFLGFLYTLYAPAVAFNITCLVVVLCSRIRWSTALLLLVFNSVLYYWTSSRLSFVASIAVVVAAVVLKKTSLNSLYGTSKKIFSPLIFSFIVCALVSVCITCAYDPSISWMQDLNEMSGNRIAQGKIAYMSYGIPVMGQEAEFHGAGLTVEGEEATIGTSEYVDSLYVKVLIQFGWVLFAALLIGLTIVCYKAWKSGNLVLLSALAITALHCVLDDLSFYLCFNSLLLLIGPFVLKENKDRDPLGIELEMSPKDYSKEEKNNMICITETN